MEWRSRDGACEPSNPGNLTMAVGHWCRQMSLLLPALEHGIIIIKGTGPVWEQGSVYRSGRKKLENSGKVATGAYKKATASLSRSKLVDIEETLLVQDLTIRTNSWEGGEVGDVGGCYHYSETDGSNSTHSCF